MSTGFAPPKMEAARLDWEVLAEESSSLGVLRGFRFSLGLWGGPTSNKTLSNRFSKSEADGWKPDSQTKLLHGIQISGLANSAEKVRREIRKWVV